MRWQWASWLVVLLAACAAEPVEMPFGDEETGEDDELGATASEIEVGDMKSAVRASCATSVARGLSMQLVQEVQCGAPSALVSIDGIAGVSYSDPVMRYLQPEAAESLRRAVSRGGGGLQLTSALRTLPQQYLVYQWYQLGRCGIGIAARPGRSNHESGLALDVSNHGSWRNLLTSEGFVWAGSSDRVHFDYRRAGVDLRAESVRAFQRLWNRNHPEDRISEDGAYGPQTEARLSRAPASGFPIGASCAPGEPMEPEEPMMPEEPEEPTMPPATGGWQAVHAGLTQSGSEIPRRGLTNQTLRGALGISTEPYGDVTTLDGRSFVSGRTSWFGGPNDTGVTSTETGAISGERLRSLNSPLSPSAATLASRPGDYYFVAMRWDYRPNGTSWWRNARLLVVNPATGAAIVVRPVDWGPNTSTRRILDLSPQAMRDLGIDTDDTAIVSFAAPGTPLGVVR